MKYYFNVFIFILFQFVFILEISFLFLVYILLKLAIMNELDNCFSSFDNLKNFYFIFLLIRCLIIILYIKVENGRIPILAISLGLGDEYNFLIDYENFENIPGTINIFSVIKNIDIPNPVFKKIDNQKCMVCLLDNIKILDMSIYCKKNKCKCYICKKCFANNKIDKCFYCRNYFNKKKYENKLPQIIF